MNAGDGPRSYVQNSSYQRGVIEVSKPIIEEEIATKLDITTSPNSVICIADFGCSTGHNSFPAMQFIAQAIKRSVMEKTGSTREIHAFFNDIATNDFNTLFSSLPPERLYNAFGVPGGFHSLLLPRSSIHFAYSSWSLHWLTEVPKGVVANKDRIFYAKDRKEVCDAYLEQYSRDMDAFLKSRACEMVPGGLMALLVPGEPEFWDPDTEYIVTSDHYLFESCLVEMAKEGRIREAKVESFNIPFYFPTPKQLESILKKSQSFSIERMEILSNHPGKQSVPSFRARAAFLRAVMERMLTNHFGSEIIDELFDLFVKKLEISPANFLDPKNDKSIMVLAVLKRMAILSS